MRHVLDPYSDVRSVHITERTDDFPFYHHISAREIKQEFVRTGWPWAQYRKFCVVRNPYDRVVSLFHHYRQGLREKGQDPATAPDFKAFVNSLDPTRALRAPVTYFILDSDGSEIVDDILQFERLESQLPGYLDQLGLDPESFNLPVLNASEQRDHYRAYYTQETRDKVADFFRYEIDRFSYQF